MPVQNNLGGTGQLTIDGAAQPLGASLTESRGGLVRTAKAGISGPVGTTSKYEMGTVDVELMDVGGTVSTDYLAGITSSTILWANDNGKTVVYTGCAQVEAITTNPVEGTIKVKFTFMARTELTA